MSQCGPNLPPSHHSNKVIGPTLPPHLNKSPDSSETNLIGPSLPPHLLNKEDSLEDEPSIIESPIKEEIQSSSNTYGPSLPPNLNKSTHSNNDRLDDDDVYGPLPPGASSSSSQVHRALEERALEIKLGHVDLVPDNLKAREEWMMELPEIRTGNLGLGARQFRKNQRPDFSDRTSWTDTPEQKLKKSDGKIEKPIDLKKEAELRQMRKRDKVQAKLAEKHNKKKKRDKSLLDMHQEELKKKKKSEDGSTTTRRPFNREIDLKVNQFDDAQKKSIMKKAMLLDDRFSSGQSKFL